MSDVEINKFQQRIDKLKLGNSNKGATELNGSPILECAKKWKRRKKRSYLILSLSSQERKMDTLPKIFGMNYFNNNNISFEPNVNIPTPLNYRLGPGDEIIIDLWGDSEQTYQKQISPDGYIRIARLGPIYLNGLEIIKMPLKK